MKESKRALRRHHRRRRIAHARHLYIWRELGPNSPDVWKWARRNYNHIKACSCWRCGNPRKWQGRPTIQEIRHAKGVRCDKE